MENKDWTVVHGDSNRADLECGSEHKTVRRPAWIDRTTFIRFSVPGSTMDNNTINYFLEKK